MKNRFTARLSSEIGANARNWHRDNWPADDKGPEPEAVLYPAFRRLAADVKRSRAAQWSTNLYRERLRPLIRDALLFVFPAWVYRRQIPRFEGASYLYDLLENERSRDLLVKLLAYRIMGHKRVKLPRNTPEHDHLIRQMGRLPIVGAPIKIGFMDLTLELRDLSPIGFDLRTYCTLGGGSYVFLQRQYEYHDEDVHCAAEPGDVVIDAGACWGETSLYFAHQTGPDGRVISFEFIPSNLEVLQRNIEANPQLAKRITIVQRPLWNESDKRLYYVDWGPGSRVSFEKLRADFDDTQCETATVDEVIADLGLSRLDLIKMDIEGAELNALKGSERSIRKYHPKLAISLYHSIDDFCTIPRFIDSLGLPYKYYLDHHTIYENETVLFAVPQRH